MMSSRVQGIGFLRQNAQLAHFTERENLLLTRSYSKYCPIYYRADQPFDAIAGQRKNGFEDGLIVIEGDAPYRCDSLKK